MALELTKRILEKPPSDPLKPWVFGVRFLYSNENQDLKSIGFELNRDEDISLVPIKIDLPGVETTIVTQKFFGTEKSFPIIRKHSGETSMEFYVHTDPRENDFIISNFMKDFFFDLDEGSGDYIHKEFYTVFDTIEIDVLERINNPSRSDGKIYTYVLQNCIPIKLDQSNLGYDSDEVMKYTLNVHYDDWYIKLNNEE